MTVRANKADLTQAVCNFFSRLWPGMTKLMRGMENSIHRQRNESEAMMVHRDIHQNKAAQLTEMIPEFQEIHHKTTSEQTTAIMLDPVLCGEGAT